MPTEVKEELKTITNLFTVLQKRKNFMVDVRGKIILILRKLELNEVREKEVEIKLKFVGEEEKQEERRESNIFEEFGGEIEHLEFPSFAEDRVVEGFEKEMVIYRF